MNLMLDIETLSTEPNAMVFEVAIVPFTDSGKVRPGHLHICFNATTGHIDPATVQWWLNRADACTLGKSAMSESGAAEKIETYLHTRSAQYLWAQPTSFDCVVLQQFLMRNGHGPALPIDSRQWRDLRTARELANWPRTEKRDGHTSHNAYDDCVRQIDTLAECWRILK